MVTRKPWYVYDGLLYLLAMKSDQIVSAQVLLRAASGKRPDARALITADTINEWMPSAESVVRVSQVFRTLGYEVGELVGNSLSITAPVRLFESLFHTRLKQSKDSGIQFATPGRSPDYELATEKIPADLKELIVAVTFTPPPDFGPSGFSNST